MPDYSKSGIEDINGKVTMSSGYVMVGENPKSDLIKRSYTAVSNAVNMEVLDALRIFRGSTNDFAFISISSANSANVVIDKELAHLQDFIAKLKESDSITPQIASIEGSIANARKKLQKK